MNTETQTQELWQRRLQLFPITAEVRPSPRDGSPALTVGGCDLDALAHEYGTPLYCFDAATRRRGRAHAARLPHSSGAGRP
ncbi:MAG: hypothetical protein H6643_02150 [Caldilineaceae bacterium]|nr:hypothetical protein [Caldilineaceae bacterium]